jgi:2-methylcitrate dehydratase PrpD
MFMGVGCANGILASDLAALGVTGLEDIVGDWMPVIVPSYDSRRLTNRLGEFYEMTVVLYKHVALVGPLFVPLEAMLALLEESPFEAEDVDHIVVEGYRRLLMMIRPVPPRTPEGVRGNLGYALGSAIVHRDRDFFLKRAFDEEARNDPRVLEVSKKVNVLLNEDYQLNYPHNSDMCKLRVTLRDGRELEKELDLRSITRYRFPTRDEIEHKFRAVVEGNLDSATTDRVIEAVWNLDAEQDINKLTTLLA